jgi:succinyl-diaminopimelate desuccinylase
MDKQDLMHSIDKKRSRIAEDLVKICSIPAINPSFGGDGEYKRVQWLMGYLDDNSVPYSLIEVEDQNVKENKRLNLMVQLQGTEKTEKTLWFISHLDTVALGDLNSWETDPANPIIKDGKIYGRGVEDNGQAIVCSLYTCLTLIDAGIRTKCNLGFLFVSDEESGSEYGLKALAKTGLFKIGDEAVVPDAGNHDGSFVEIAEKSILWVKFTVFGKEAHASFPHLGINASSIACHFAAELEDLLKERFPEKDDLYDPPYSTFEITQKYANVDSPNVLPGKDVFVMDLRVLPTYKLDEVIKVINTLASQYEYRHKARIKFEFLQRVDSPKPTDPNSEIVSNLRMSLNEYGIESKIGGIGGGTCAAILRELDIPAVVWSTVDEMAHQPNEYAIIDNLVKDTKIFISTILKYV